MTLEDLRAFVSAYRTRSLSEAARRSGCTQGAIAQHVRRLERELGVELFSRGRKGVVPTEAGRLLYEGVSLALESIGSGLERVRGYLEGRKSRLALTASAFAVSGFLRAPILELKRTQPDAEIHLEPENTAEGRLELLREGCVDLALSPDTASVHGLETRPCMKIELVLLVHAKHPLAERCSVSPRELCDIHYIAQGTDTATYRHLKRSLHAAGVPLEPATISEDPTAAILMVELGRGETFVSRQHARELERTGSVRGVRVKALPPIEILWVARSFSLLPEVAWSFMRIFDRVVVQRG